MPTIIEELVIALGYKVDDKPLTEAEKKAEASAAKISASWQKIGDAATKVGAAATVAVGGLVAIAAKAGAAGAAIADVADRSGYSTKEIQRLGHAADMTGSSASTLQGSLKFLAKSIVDARNSSSPAADALKKLGVNLSDIDGKTAEQQFSAIADGFSKLEDDALKTDLALTIFGKAGGELVPMLSAGGAAVRQFGDDLTNMGGVMSDQAVAKAAEFDDQLLVLKKQLSATVNEIGVNLIPILQSCAKNFDDVIIVVGGFATALAAVKLVAFAHNLGLVGTAMAAVKWSAGIAGALAFGVALGTALDNALDLSDAIAGVQGTQGKRGGNAFVGELTTSEQAELATLQKRRDEIDADIEGRKQLGMMTGSREEKRAATDAAIARLQARGTARVKDRAAGRAIIGAGGKLADAASEGFDNLLGGAGDYLSARGRGVSEFVTSAPKEIRAKKKPGKGKSADQRKAEEELAAALVEVRTMGIEEELQALGLRAGASDKAINAAINAAAQSQLRGDSRKVVKSAGVGALSSATGADLSKRQTDPTLAALFGEDTLPDVPLSELERGQQPQVLIATINNTYSISNTFDIDGARDPAVVADTVVESMRTVLRDEVSKVSKFSKVIWER